MRFTIVIPTRNRAACLPLAIRSALAQTHDDFEVLVSNNASTDETEEVLKSFSDPRLRSIRTDRPLSMPDHWEFALGRAAGQWATFLCDDDSLIPDGLSTLEGLIRRFPECRVIQYGQLVYVYDDGIEGEGNYLRYRRPIPETARVLDSGRRLSSAFADMSWDMPKFLNAAVRLDLAASIRERHGRVFHDWAPDYSSGVLLLAHAGHHVVTQRPVVVWGKNLRSYGSGAQADPAHLQRFLSEFPAYEGTFQHSPYPELRCVNNMLCDTLNRTAAMLPEWRDRLAVRGRVLRRILLEDVHRYVERGHDAYRTWESRLTSESRAKLDPAGEALDALRARAARKWRKYLERMTGTRTRITKVYGGGKEAAFTNIFEAAEYFWRTEALPGR